MRTKKAAVAKQTDPVADQAPVQPVDSSQLTPEELAIARRVAAEGPILDHGEEGMVDFSLAEDPLKLPEPALKEQREKRLAFRWIRRSPERIDQVRNASPPLRWWICNRVNTPFLAKYVDPVLGAVVRMDLILVCKPWSHFMAEQKAKLELADMGTASTIKAKDGVRDGKGEHYEWKGGMRPESSTDRLSAELYRAPLLEEGKDFLQGGSMDAAGGEDIIAD